jgi:hypothetical protein
VRALAWLTVAVLLVAAGPLAAAPSQEEQAREHFAAGQREYQAGRFTEALRQFELGYALSPRPEFLINFAQVYRKLGDWDRAIAECERYLATAPPPSLAAEAERLLARVREERAAHATAPPATTPPPTETKPAPPAETKPSAPAETPPAIAAPPPPSTAEPTAPPRKRRWVWALVGTSIGLAVAAGVTLAVVFAPVHDTFPTTTGGAVDFR